MNDNNSSGQFPVPSVALILLALGVFILSDSPFQPTRPDSSYNQIEKKEKVISRLWQDPFEAVELHRNNKHKNDSISNYHILCNPAENSINKSNKPLPVQILEVFNNEKSKNKNPNENMAHSIDELNCEIRRDIKTDSKDFDLHVIAVMVAGGSYAESKESRIRSRYAITTGLLNIGYRPTDSNHISYMDFSDKCKYTTSNNIDYCNWPSVIPYEWYKPDELTNKAHDNLFAENLLVLWLDNEEISRKKPLDLLQQIKNSLMSDQHKPTGSVRNKKNEQENIKIIFDVIGPSNSTSLVQMYVNLTDQPCHLEGNCNHTMLNNYADIRIFSPRATLDDDAITTILKKRNIENIINFPGLYRTISTDSMLVDELLCEMLRRGINPFHEKKHLKNFLKKANVITVGANRKICTDFSMAALNRGDKKNYLVLIGEGDTVYSRNFNRLFRTKINDLVSGNNDESVSGAETDISWLYSFNYLRGLDGEIGNRQSNGSGSTDKNNKEFRKAIGANQFDYLRRLANQLSELSKSIKDEGSIRVIGIVGSDTYDKLLILQSLRNRFPDVLFFTTDLDARLLHQDENQWARNLIVASAFGLKPEASNKKDFTGFAFRDSYQTALYNTIHKVVSKDAICDISNEQQNTNNGNLTHNNQITSSKELISPVKIFEIGNSSAVDYSQVDDCSLKGNCAPDKNTTLYIVLSLILFLLLLLQTSNKTRLYIFSIALIISTVSITVYLFDLSHNKEFEAMFTGTSVWPAYIIRMIASVTAILTIIYAIISLKRNTVYIIKEHELSDNVCPSLFDKVRDEFSQSDMRFFKTITPIVPQLFQRFFCCECYDKNTIDNRRLKKPDRLSYFLITTWGWRNKEHNSVSIEQIFYQYIELGRTRFWFSRVVVFLVMYGVLSFMFLHSFPSMPITPFVGKVSADAGKFILLSVLIPYLFLIFLVSDITQLNARFIELLTKYTVTWPESVLRICCEKYGLTKEVATEKLKLDLIVSRSKVVDELIFLPFIILTLMILSRSSYFDRWHMPLELAFIILLGACIALGSAIRLRRRAKRARFYALKNLSDLYAQQLYLEENPDNTTNDGSGVDSKHLSQRIQNMIIEIESISTGPFLPIAQHPIISAVAMPFGGVGGLYLIDYLSTMGL